MDPTHIDPRTITGGDWPGFANLVYFLWAAVICNVLLAFCMLMAHAVVPSLIHTAEIPRGLRVIRPFLTIGALIAFAGTAFVLLAWIGGLPVVYEIYPKRLI